MGGVNNTLKTVTDPLSNAVAGIGGKAGGGGEGASAFLKGDELDLTQLGLSVDQTNAILRGIGGQFGELGAQSGALGTQFGGQFGNLAGQAGTQFGDIAGELRGISRGDDPAFARFREAQLGLLEGQRGRGVSALNTELARTGVRGTAAINERGRLATQFDEQARAFTSGLGLQQLGRQDQARLGAAGVLGQGFGLQSQFLGQGFGAQQAGLQGQGQALSNQAGLESVALQNQFGIPTLQVAQTAANRAGGGGGGKK